MTEKKTSLLRSRKWLAAAGLLAGAGTVALLALTGGAAQTAAYDFNGDSIPDFTVGIPGDTVGGSAEAGSVLIADGTLTGPASSASLLNQDSTGVPGAAEEKDAFGQVLASGDFDGDGYADLAVGAPVEAIGTTEGAGFLTVHYGTSSGLSSTRIDSFHEDTTGIPGTVVKDEFFAYALAAGDLNGDGHDDLAIGQPMDAVDGKPNAGSLRLLFGSADGLTATSAIWIDQGTPNVPGGPETDDRFGEQLTIGDINGDGTDDLVAATLGEQITGSSDRGSTVVMYGPVNDAPASGDYIASKYLDGVTEFSGSALAVGRFNEDPYLDIAIGVADQKVGEDGAAGRLAIVYGSADGVSHDNVELFDQGTPGVPGGPEPEDYFASSLAAGDFDGDGVDDLIVGMRSEAIGTATGSGAALVLFGNATGGISTTGRVWVDQDVEGVPGVVAKHDHFGWTVGALDTDGDGRVEPLIGAPGNAAGTVTVLKVSPGTLESATAYAEADFGLATGSHGDAFGIALPR
ncbi:FG-GAP-like repeat-containing protein [Streptomyces gobiensis]|uniref:FG-GAP-like repeat-containing protein n=1 Tax=Streptomyces gobiensis TaxID=2875706 RepID=UPI001E300A60|nr:FG-GAP-like repeat-containing protein [Streptomyces gobiensis]UGY93053.1 FG-GAP repeat protein [Streptomyces gobiensis]